MITWKMWHTLMQIPQKQSDIPMYRLKVYSEKIAQVYYTFPIKTF